MFVPDWNTVAKGTSVSVVIDGMVFTDTMVMGISLPDHRPVRIFGEINTQVRGCRRLTVLGALVDFTPPSVDLLLTDASEVVAHGLKPACEVFRTVEFCAGLGATGVGLAAAGFDLACSVEWRAPLASLHETVHPSVPVVLGDIGDLACLKQVASLVDPPFA